MVSAERQKPNRSQSMNPEQASEAASSLWSWLRWAGGGVMGGFIPVTINLVPSLWMLDSFPWSCQFVTFQQHGALIKSGSMSFLNTMLSVWFKKRDEARREILEHVLSNKLSISSEGLSNHLRFQYYLNPAKQPKLTPFQLVS